VTGTINSGFSVPSPEVRAWPVDTGGDPHAPPPVPGVRFALRPMVVAIGEDANNVTTEKKINRFDSTSYVTVNAGQSLNAAARVAYEYCPTGTV